MEYDFTVKNLMKTNSRQHSIHIKITESVWNLEIQAYIMKYNSEENFVKETLLKILRISGV